MQIHNPHRRAVLGALSALAAAGCGGPLTTTGAAGPPLPAPTLRVGDTWVYDCSDGFRTPVTWTETHKITSVSAAGIVIDVTLLGPTMNYHRVERLSAPGVVLSGSVYDNAETRNFIEPMIRYQFPLTPGTSWRQALRNPDAQTGLTSNVLRTVRVNGFQQVTVPAGTFNAIMMWILMSVDDNNAFRTPTNCTYQLWWAAEAGGMVRQTKRAEYFENGDGPGAIAIRAQNMTMELVSYTFDPKR